MYVSLVRCESKLRAMAAEFNNSNFTDRYGDGEHMLRLADEAAEVIARVEAK